MLSKKYYIAIAELIKVSKDKKEIINNLSDYFKSDNYKFKKDKFIEACRGK